MIGDDGASGAAHHWRQRRQTTFSQHDVPAQADATYVHAGVSRQLFPVSRSKLHSSTIAA
jgi:hypothetical protein